jgi:alcohol dehydrogenase (cytochrome c)
MQRKRISTLLLALGASCTSTLAGVPAQDILNDAKTTGDVVSWGIGTQGQRTAH